VGTNGYLGLAVFLYEIPHEVLIEPIHLLMNALSIFQPILLGLAGRVGPMHDKPLRHNLELKIKVPEVGHVLYLVLSVPHEPLVVVGRSAGGKHEIGLVPNGMKAGDVSGRGIAY